MKTILVSLISICFIFNSSAQNLLDQNQLKKNHIHYSIGTLLFFSSSQVSYERLFFYSKGDFPLAIGANLGIGIYSTDDSSDEIGFLFNPNFVFLTGRNKNHFEARLGLTFLDLDNLIRPSYLAGYRFQKPEGGWSFRTGMGFPETVYVGVGYSF